MSARRYAEPAPSVTRGASRGTRADRRPTFTPADVMRHDDAMHPFPFHGHDDGGEWPLRSHLELRALPSAVPCARLHVKHVLWEWSQAGLGESVQLFASELATNAIRVSRTLGPDALIRIWLLSNRSQVLLCVWDGSPEPPVRTEASDVAESGRGLLLVETISDQWGWFPAHPVGGKWVWCAIQQASASTAAHAPR